MMTSDPTLLQPSDQLTHFDPLEYLHQYYGTNCMSRGLKIILSFLPNIAARLPNVDRFLDIGSGPTIFMAVGFRNKAKQIYLSDYAEQNRRELSNWLNEKISSPFDWSPICQAIDILEGRDGRDWHELEKEAKGKVKGVLFCDVHQEDVLGSNQESESEKFDIVSSVFCLEYASSDSDQYRRAMKNICNLIKPGGWLVLGSAFRESYYVLGKKKFKCHYLTEEELFEALEQAEIMVNDKSFAYYFHDDAFVVVGRKGE